MRKLVMLSWANIRKTRGHTVSLFLMFLIASLLLNAGLLVMFNFGSFFEKNIRELNTSDVYYIMQSQYYTSEIEDYLRADTNVVSMQKEDVIWSNVTIPYKGEQTEITVILSDGDQERDSSKWKFVGEHLPPESMSVYLPYVLSLDGGYKLNDLFELTVKDTRFTFKVKGFTEDVLFSSLDTGSLGLYLPHETYGQVTQKLGAEGKAVLVHAGLAEVNKQVEAGIRERIAKGNAGFDPNSVSGFFSMNLDLIKMSRVLMSSILSVMTVAFAAIIAAVCLIVVRFRIGNSIEEDMTKIGSLRSVGYTSRQIITTIVMQYSIIALLGSVAGIALSFSVTPVLSAVFAHQSGLKWVQGFDGGISSSTLGLILLIVVIVAIIASRRIHKLNPIVALRGGIVTHNFRRNFIPLDRSKGRLPVALGLKSMLQNGRQSLMIGVILTAVAFAGTFALMMFYNTVVDIKSFKETPGIEISNAVAVLSADADRTRLVDEISSMNGVRKAQFIDEVKLRSGKNDLTAYVMNDYAAKETNTVYEGRYPRHSNEIVLAGQLAELLHKTTGDRVMLEAGTKQAEYLITGLSQGSNMGGMNASIRLDGLLQLRPEFKPQTLQIYLNSGVNAEVFGDELEHKFGASISATQDMDTMMEQGVSMYTSIISKVGITMMVITILVVILVLYFVINSTVIRKKRELGIQKAIGFTTLQLMNQLSLGLLPPITIGVVIGSVLGLTQTNTIMSAAQRSMGIMKANYIMMTSWVVLFGLALIIVSYLTSLLLTSRIRTISAYALVNE
ncbi:ABC transporter permease [Paenibacillus sp. MMS20-IR301]|uniref:ABC transporter permease n=1 Tax=Paenibacillus sp. MMS20-IR301 TaxID=2895946 RepID=UPI0028F159FB|nr:ABC transporter permease [Paenibacillus sp. MMS20-IR301]WNS40724.1 ABC transporter permease [Paenibacillus sp. MMS20-IR301]